MDEMIDTKPFSCDHCGTKYRLKSQLLYHLATAHKLKEPTADDQILYDGYVCVACSQKIEWLQSLDEHLKEQHGIHDGAHLLSTVGFVEGNTNHSGTVETRTRSWDIRGIKIEHRLVVDKREQA